MTTIPPLPVNEPSPEVMSEFIFEEAQSGREDDKTPYQREERWIIIEKVANQLEQNRGERVKYAKRTFYLTCCWIAFVLLVVVASGITIEGQRLLSLSEKILIVLITTTTLNVFGFFILVMQFLFNRQEMATIEFLFTGKRNLAEKPSIISASRKAKPTNGETGVADL